MRPRKHQRQGRQDEKTRQRKPHNPRKTTDGGLKMNMVKWLEMDLQENMLAWKHPNEVNLSA